MGTLDTVGRMTKARRARRAACGTPAVFTAAWLRALVERASRGFVASQMANGRVDDGSFRHTSMRASAVHLKSSTPPLAVLALIMLLVVVLAVVVIASEGCIEVHLRLLVGPTARAGRLKPMHQRKGWKQQDLNGKQILRVRSLRCCEVCYVSVMLALLVVAAVVWKGCRRARCKYLL